MFNINFNKAKAYASFVRVCTFFKNCFDSGYFTAFKGFVAAVSAYIIHCLTSEASGTTLKSNLGNTGGWIIDNGGLVVFLVALIMTIYQVFYFVVDKYAFNWEKKYLELEKKSFLNGTVLSHIENIVVAKRERFAKVSKKFKSLPTKPDSGLVFHELTQPNDQMKIIMESLLQTLKAMYLDVPIKVALMKVKNNKLDDWECCRPYKTTPRLKIHTLRNPHSTFSHCLRDQEIKIIPDTQIELRKPNESDRLYIKGNTSVDDQWCVVCYPIMSINDSAQIIYIISIAIKRPNVFNASSKNYLEELLGFFESRLALEHSLEEIKDLTL